MRARGAALILVLWLIALLALLVGAYALTARMELFQGQVARDTSVGRERARAGIEYALVRVADTQARTRWVPDGRRYTWQFVGQPVQVRVFDEGGKVDINQADANLLTQLLRVTGVDADTAPRLAASILDWRDADSLNQPQGGAEDADYAAAGLAYGAKDAPFESVEELQQVLGMDARIYAAIAPYVTIYTGRALPDARYAAGPVLTAMGADAERVLAQRELPQEGDWSQIVGGGSGTYSIESRATLRAGRVAGLRAVIRAGGGPVPGSAYTVLRWEEGAPPP